MSNIYTFTLGDFECTVIKDSGAEMVADEFFSTVPEGERIQAIANSPYDPAAIALSQNILLLEKDGQRIIIETGNTTNDSDGTDFFPLLQEAGIEPESIDIVTLTHAHADHYSGMLFEDGSKRFPNANYVMWKKEWDYYSSDERMAIELERGQARYDYIKKYLGGLEPYLSFISEENDMLADGIRAIPAIGHTKHHVRFEVTSQGKTLHILGDAFIHPLCLDNPHWTFPFDGDDEQSIATRRDLRDSVGDDLVLVYHFPFPGVGYVKRDNGRYSWEEL